VNLRRLRALVKKEFLQIIRDSSTLLIAFVLPLILLFIYGYGISLDITNMKIGCVMEDRGPAASGLVQSLTHSPFFSIEFEENSAQMVKDITDGKILGGIVIPSYYSDFLENKDQVAPVFLVADGSQPNTAGFVKNYVTGAFSNNAVQAKTKDAEPPEATAKTVPRFWFNEELDSHHFLIPGSIAIIMTLIGTMLTALVVAREWERGTMEALMATPLTLLEIIIGKLIPYFILGLVSMFLCTAIGCLLFGVPLRGSLIALTIVSSVFLCASLGLGLLISSLTRNQFNASQIAIVTAFLPAFMLSGFIFEITSMPFRIQLMTYIIPARYMVSSLQTIFLVGNVPALLWKNCFAMALFAIVLFAIMTLKSTKRLD
jgi:ABC-2 type transport system permease protein